MACPQDIAVSPQRARKPSKPRRTAPRTKWRPLDVKARAEQPGETRRRCAYAALCICVLPPLCALLLLPFFYRKSNAAVLSLTELEGSHIYCLPEYEEVLASGEDPAWYEWMRMADPRQCLAPDLRAGFSRFSHYRPHYAAAACPQYQSTKPARQPLYHELFALISPQSPRTLVNEQLNLLWQRQNSLARPALPLRLKPTVHRPVWRLIDGTPVAVAEAPVFPEEVLAYWRDADTRTRLAERPRGASSEASGQTLLELQVPPGVSLPRLSASDPHDWEPPLVVPRIVLRRSCGDGRLDQAAMEALRVLLAERSEAMQSAPPGNHLLIADWSCW